jgi:hypothetical protein
MDRYKKHSARLAKSRAFADYARVVDENHTWFLTTPGNIFICLNAARANEKNAVKAERSCETLRQEAPASDPPTELSDPSIA